MTDRKNTTNTSSNSTLLATVRGILIGLLAITSVGVSFAGIIGINMLMRWADGSSLSGPGGAANFASLFFLYAAVMMIFGSIIWRRETYSPLMALVSTAFGMIGLFGYQHFGMDKYAQLILIFAWFPVLFSALLYRLEARFQKKN